MRNKAVGISASKNRGSTRMNWSLVLAGKSQRNLRESWCVPLNFPPGNCFYHPTGECVLKNAGWSFFLQSNFQIYTAKMRNHCLCFYTWMIMPKVKVTRLLCSGGFPNFLQQGSLQQRHNSFVNLGEDFFTLEKRPGKGKGFFFWIAGYPNNDLNFQHFRYQCPSPSEWST